MCSRKAGSWKSNVERDSLRTGCRRRSALCLTGEVRAWYKELTDGSRSAATPKIDVGMEIMITLVTLVGCSIIILFIIFIMIWFCQAVSPKQSKHNVVTILLKICLDHNQEVIYCLDHLLQMR